ncbi:MAG: Uma2 family endonuclease [Pirellulales bacterium]|nr:Uma2 family endonuclease [Pirellulales bacterium]
MSTQPIQKYTVDEYLAIEATSELRYQFYQGEIFAMAGGSLSHTRIAHNLHCLANQELRDTGCEYLGEGMRVYCSPSLYTYPDGLIVCGEPFLDGRYTPSLVNPRVIFDILSPSTENFDRGQKFIQYQRIATLCDYVLISQFEPHCDHYVKTEHEGWKLRCIDGLDARIELSCVSCELPLRDLYDRVVFES